MTDPRPAPLDLAASLAEDLAPDGEHVDPFAELALPAWTPDLVLGDDGLVAVDDETLGGVARVRPRWRVDSDERADYALRRAAMYDEELARAEGFARTQKQQIDQWLEKVTKPIRDARAFFVGSAADYARRLREADPKFRTLPLPAGRLTAHDTRAGVEVVDADAYTAWALEQGHDECVKVETTPKLREIAARYTVKGDVFISGEAGGDAEVVPGLRPRAKGWKPDAKPEALSWVPDTEAKEPAEE